MKIRELLFENLSAKPVKYKIIRNNKNIFEVKFKVGKATILFDGTTGGADNWMISFSVEKIGGVKTETFEKYKPTDLQDAPTVFSTIYEITKEFINLKNPKTIMFTSIEERLKRIYLIFLKRLDKMLPGYIGKYEGKGKASKDNEVLFVLERKD